MRIGRGLDRRMIAVERLVIGYSDAPVCAPLTFVVRPGQALAVVGPNGAGKSTLLRTLVGILEPLSGDVSVLGAPLDERTAEFRAAVATVFDDDAFFPSLTVAEHPNAPGAAATLRLDPQWLVVIGCAWGLALLLGLMSRIGPVALTSA